MTNFPYAKLKANSNRKIIFKINLIFEKFQREFFEKFNYFEKWLHKILWSVLKWKTKTRAWNIAAGCYLQKLPFWNLGNAKFTIFQIIF